MALWVVLPFRSVPFTRSDGVVVMLPAPDRLDHTSDTWDYLQIAREIYRWPHHYESLFTYVPFLPDWGGAAVDAKPGPYMRFPVLWRQPGFPMLIAKAFALRGSSDPGVLPWIQGAAIVLLPLATYFLASAFLSPGWAFFAGLWSLLSPIGLSAKSPFVATTWFTVIIAFLAGLLVRSNHARLAICSGVVLAIAVLFRFETWMLLPGLLLMSWFAAPAGGVRVTVIMLTVAAMLLVPWFRLRVECVGEGFTLTSLLYHDTDSFPGWISSRTLAVRDLSPIGFVTNHTGEVLKKSVLDLLRYGRDLATFPSPFLAPFVWISILRPPESRRARGFIYGMVVSALSLVIVLCPLEYSPRFLAALIPLFATTAALAISRFVRHRRWMGGVATVVGAVLTTAALIGRPHDGTARLAAADLNEVMREPAKWLPASGRLSRFPWVALCDAPTMYAWIWDAPAVWTPVPEDVQQVRSLLRYSNCVAIFTRAGGHGDGVTADTVEKYFNAGFVSTTTHELPLFMYWPPPSRYGPWPLQSRYGPITPQGTPP